MVALMLYITKDHLRKRSVQISERWAQSTEEQKKYSSPIYKIGIFKRLCINTVPAAQWQPKSV